MVAILKLGTQLQQLTWKEKALAMEQCNQTRGINIVKDQLLSEGQYAELRMQIILNNAILEQCSKYL